MDGLDRDAVLAPVQKAAPEVIVHQMTALSDLKDFSRFDEEFAVTNELRTRGTDYLLEAARLAGTRRFIAQSFTGFTNEYAGTPVKTEDDPLNPDRRPRPGRRWRRSGTSNRRCRVRCLRGSCCGTAYCTGMARRMASWPRCGQACSR